MWKCLFTRYVMSTNDLLFQVMKSLCGLTWAMFRMTMLFTLERMKSDGQSAWDDDLEAQVTSNSLCWFTSIPVNFMLWFVPVYTLIWWSSKLKPYMIKFLSTLSLFTFLLLFILLIFYQLPRHQIHTTHTSGPWLHRSLHGHQKHNTDCNLSCCV